MCDCVGAAGRAIVCAFAVWKPVEGRNFCQILGREWRGVWWHVIWGHRLGMACEEMRKLLQEGQRGYIVGEENNLAEAAVERPMLV